MAKPLAERRSTFDRRRSAYRLPSAPCNAAAHDSRSVGSGPSELAERCWQILSACLPSFEMIRATDAAAFVADETSIFHDLLRSELFRHLRSALPPGSTN